MTTLGPIHQLAFEDLNKFSAERYNNLQSVEEADRKLKQQPEFNEFLEKFLNLTLENKMELGLRLIHKHMLIEQTGEKAMVEKFGTFNNMPAFISSSEFTNEETFPASWLLNEDKTLNVFEYSTDLRVKKTIDRLIEDCSVFEMVCQLIRQYHLESLLAPCIYSRDAMIHFDVNQAFVERTHSSASVVQNATLNSEEPTIVTSYGTPVTVVCIGCH
jgi:hypothetical protein